MSGAKSTFKTVGGNVNAKLRGTNQQSDTGLVYVNGSYTDHNRTSLKFEGISVASFSLQNRSGGAAVLGFGYRLPNRLWIAGQWDDTGGATQYVDDTTDAQDTDTDDFALETTTQNDGFVVASRVPFNCISINCSTASNLAASNPVRALRYSNSAGTGWTNITTADLLAADGVATGGAEFATGEQVIMFTAPFNWGRTSSLGDIPDGYYAINCRSTTQVDTTAGLARCIELWNIPYVKEAVADNGTLEYVPLEPIHFEFADAVGAFFGTANEGNQVFAQIRPS